MAQSIYSPAELQRMKPDELVDKFELNSKNLGGVEIVGQRLPDSATLPHDVAALSREIKRRLSALLV